MSTPAAFPAFMEPYARHVLVCTGGFCSTDRGGRALYSKLASLLEREGLLFGPKRVKRSEAPCLGVCGGGPIVAVYPEGVWYSGVTPELLALGILYALVMGLVGGLLPALRAASLPIPSALREL